MRSMIMNNTHALWLMMLGTSLNGRKNKNGFVPIFIVCFDGNKSSFTDSFRS